MKRRILTVCLLLALLLTACGGQNREPENPPDVKPSAPGEEAAEPPDETPEPEPAKPEEKEPLTLENLLTEIYTVAPGTAGSSLRATYAAGELLDWIDVNSVEQEDVFRWIDENVPMENAAELARAWAAVLTEAEALMRGDETAYDALDDAGYTMEQPYRSTGRVKWAAWKLLPLFTQILDRTERTEYRYEAPGDYSAVTEEALGYLGGRCGYHCSVVFRGRLPHRVSGTGVAWRNRLCLPRPGPQQRGILSGVGHRLSAK